MKKIFVSLALIVLVVLVASCGAAATEEPQADYAAGAPMEVAPAEAPMAAEMVIQTVVVEKVVEAESIAATPVPSGSGGGLTDILPQDAGRMIIKDALVDLLVEDTERSINDVTQLAASQGGYIISARSWYAGPLKYANLRLGVPSANFERTLNFLRDLAVQVQNETTSGQDVSSEYNDLQIRLENLEATAARVRAFLDNAKTVEESLRINSTLSDLERQINQIKGQMKFYEGRAAFSTIEINLNPLVPTPTVTATPTITPTPTVTPTPTPWSPGATARIAARQSVGIWQEIVDFFIAVCFLGWPIFLVAALVGGLLWWRKRRRAALKEVKPPAPLYQPPEEPPAGSQE